MQNVRIMIRHKSHNYAGTHVNRYSIYVDTRYCVSAHITKPEPIMLFILPNILSRIFHIFHPLFLFYSHTITYYSIIIPQI